MSDTSRWDVQVVVRLLATDVARLRAVGIELPAIEGAVPRGWLEHTARHLAIVNAASAIAAVDLVRSALGESLSIQAKAWSVQPSELREMAFDETAP